MKKLLLIALLLPLGVVAQKKDTTSMSFSAGRLSGGTFTLDSAFYKSSIYSLESSPILWNLPQTPKTYVWLSEDKVMEVTEKDKEGNIKVWIDPKRITWTSDSTFVLKTK